MIDIKDISGNIRLSTPINEGSKRKFQLMSSDYITLKFSLAEPVYFRLGDYIDDENIPYGQEQLVEQGKAGKVKVVKKSVVSTGKAPKEVEIAREVLADPKYSVIRRGIGMSGETPAGARAEPSQPLLTFILKSSLIT